jgi:hypothetical protein
MNARDKQGIIIIQGIDYAVEETATIPGHMGLLVRRLLGELQDRRRAMGVTPDHERDRHCDHSTLEIDPFQPSDCGGA